MSDETQKGLRPERFIVPGGGGIEPHPGGLLYRRIDADAIIDGLRISLDAAEARIAHAEAENERLREALIEAERYMTYFSGETRIFEGPGMPLDCLATIRDALRGEGEG